MTLAVLALIVIGSISLVIALSNNSNNKQKESLTQEVTEPIVIVEEEPDIYSASILTAGDVILHSPFISSKIYHKGDGSYDYNSIFNYISPYYENADFSVVNFESTISTDNYSGYPSFRSPAAIATALKNSHVDMCMLANNHIYDNYDKGFSNTMKTIENEDLLFMGTQKTESDSKYTIQDINGIKVGFFNYVYETGSANGQKTINAIPVSNTSASRINSFHYNDLETFFEELHTGLEDMKKEGVEYTIAYIHWGNEYQTKENATQQKIAQNLCNLGIDALIGGHPHVVQPVDLLTNSTGDHQMVCVYSMGNHLSNQRIEFMDSMPTGHTEDGLMVELKLEQIDNGPVSLVEANFIPTWVFHTTKHGGSEYIILPLDKPEELPDSIFDVSISSDVTKSIERTNEIIKSGVEKINAALPIQNK